MQTQRTDAAQAITTERRRRQLLRNDFTKVPFPVTACDDEHHRSDSRRRARRDRVMRLDGPSR
jgi:hypothetical protein